MHTTINNQAEKNRLSVVAEQLQAEVMQQAERWDELSRKEKLDHWADWIGMSEIEQRFHPFHRVLSVIEFVQ